LHLLDLDVMQLLPSLTSLARLLVLVLAVIHDTANRRTRVRRDFDEVQPPFPCHGQSLLDRQDPQLLPLRRDHPEWTDTDLPIHTDSLLVAYGDASRLKTTTKMDPRLRVHDDDLPPPSKGWGCS